MIFKRLAVGSLCLMTMLVLAGSAVAQEEKTFNAGVSISYANKYIWRGQNINDTSVIQPNVSGSAYGFTGSVWGNIDATGKSQTAPNNAGDFSEIDYTLDYSAKAPVAPKLGYSLGIIHYLFPNTSLKSTTEIYGALSLAVPLSPKIAWYRDVNAVDGSYLQLTAGHTFEKIGKWAEDYYVGLSLTGSLGWAGSGYNKGYFGVEKTKFNDFTFSAGVPITLKSFSVTPSFNTSTMLDGQIGDAAFQRSNFWFGLGFSKSF